MTSLLLSCGDIEANPGSPPDDRGDTPLALHDDGQQDQHSCHSQSSSQLPQSLHQGVMTILKNTMKRMEANQVKHADVIKQKLKTVSDLSIERMRNVEGNQSAMASDIRELTSHCQNLLIENRALKDRLNFLNEQCESLENHRKRNNLIFLGLARCEDESWKDRAEVKTVIRQGMGLCVEIQIERAHRAGKAIVAKLLSYQQKMLIFESARRLNEADGFDNVYIKEDFSRTETEKARTWKQSP